MKGSIMEKFRKQIERYKSGVVKYTGDFQCYQTDGCPTLLCWSISDGKIWLEPCQYAGCLSDEDIRKCWERCSDFGIRDCSNAEQFNQFLKMLSDDAFDLYALYPDEESDADIFDLRD